MPSASMSDGPNFGQTWYPEKVQGKKSRVNIIITIITFIIEREEMKSPMAVKSPKMLARLSGLRIAFEGQVV